ncbi:SPOR domain-containing protein [Anthocerotibacter panamensis]|uniref:SPOR domain-containing protein n=1 Tax=Anthocerotibacter panamensis TaxID=2857077 RepID=UPI001C407EE3|nr:hypothetical protein [Anthocerotibacter panamensis]
MRKRFLSSLVWILVVLCAVVPFQPLQAANERQIAATSSTYYVFVPAPHRSTLRKVKRVVPAAWMRRLEGQRYVQAGAFLDSIHAQDMVRTLKRRGFAAFINSRGLQTASAQAPTAPVRLAALGPLPAPPVASVSLARLPAIPVAQPAPYLSLTRVLVLSQDFARAAELQQQVPGAFRRQVGGRTYIQVGAFGKPENLSQMLQSLQTLGVPATVQKPEE